MGRGGFEPPKPDGDRFTVCSLCPLGYLPSSLAAGAYPQRSSSILFSLPRSWRRELNPRPADYKSAALPTELRQQIPQSKRAKIADRIIRLPKLRPCATFKQSLDSVCLTEHFCHKLLENLRFFSAEIYSELYSKKVNFGF
jgi:hypothetical protein